MIHIYAIVLAVVLLIGALAAIIVCVCVDIVPIIKSRGSTLMSRDSVTQEQTRMLKKSLQRTKLTSSASADFIDSVQGRKMRGQAPRNERPRYGSTPLALLSGEDERSDEMSYKTTTVIIEALPKKSTSDNNKNTGDDVNTEQSEKADSSNLQEAESGNEVSPRYEIRNEIRRLQGRSGSSPNVATKRSNSLDLLDERSDTFQGAMAYSSRSPEVTTRRPQTMDRETRSNSSRDLRNHESPLDDALHSNYGHQPNQTHTKLQSKGNYAGNSDDGSTSPTNSGDPHCHWCVMERGIHSGSNEHPLAFPRNGKFNESSSPKAISHQMHRQRSFEDPDLGIYPSGFPYDRNKYCKNPHVGYSPCPDCFHSNNVPYFISGYHVDGIPQNELTSQGLKGSLPGTVPQLISTSSSSSSSGSSARFRHIRQPLEDIQEDTSDCYAMRDVGAMSTIDSRDLESGADDGTIPKSTDNSVASASPIIVSQTQSPLIPNSTT